MSETKRPADAADDRLRQLFRRMREEDADRVPAFPTLDATPQRGRRLGWMPIAATAALAVVLALWLWSPTGTEAFDDELLLADWYSPSTAFLGLEELGLADLTVASGTTAAQEPYEAWAEMPTDMLIEQADALLKETER